MSLSRSLKREMRGVGEDCGMQPITVAMAFVYFEKLVLQGRLNKQNRWVDTDEKLQTDILLTTGLTSHVTTIVVDGLRRRGSHQLTAEAV